MATVTILYWRDIPAQIIVKAGRKSAKRQLSTRFQEAIDLAAMRSKAHQAGTYLEQWRRASLPDCNGNLEAEALKLAEQFETSYGEERLALLAKAGGLEDG